MGFRFLRRDYCLIGVGILGVWELVENFGERYWLFGIGIFEGYSEGGFENEIVICCVRISYFC